MLMCMLMLIMCMLMLIMLMLIMLMLSMLKLSMFRLSMLRLSICSHTGLFCFRFFHRFMIYLLQRSIPTRLRPSSVRS